MSPNLSTVLTAAESLSIAEQCELIDLLLDRLDPPSLANADDQAAVSSEAWRQELARRSAEYDAGRAETVSWQEVQGRRVASVRLLRRVEADLKAVAWHEDRSPRVARRFEDAVAAALERIAAMPELYA